LQRRAQNLVVVRLQCRRQHRSNIPDAAESIFRRHWRGAGAVRRFGNGPGRIEI